MRSFYLDFLTRPQCGLCHAVAPVISRVARIARADLTLRDVDANDELFDRFEHRIPVVLGPDGTVLAEGEITFWRLYGAVARARIRWLVAGGRHAERG